MWILLNILAWFFNINIILGNLLETFEIFTNHLFCHWSGCAGCIVTPGRSLVLSALFCLFLCFRWYPDKVEEYIPTFYKIRYILVELYVAVMSIISQLKIYIDQINAANNIQKLAVKNIKITYLTNFGHCGGSCGRSWSLLLLLHLHLLLFLWLIHFLNHQLFT